MANALVELAKDYDLYGPDSVRTTAVPKRRLADHRPTPRRSTRRATARPGMVDLRTRVNAAAARVEAVRRIKPDVDSRDNASVLLRDPRVIDFGTIFLAGLRSDEAVVSVLAHELTHIAGGQADSLRPRGLGHARQQGLRTQDSHRVAAKSGFQGARADGADESAGDAVGSRRPRGYDGRAAGFLLCSDRREQ